MMPWLLLADASWSGPLAGTSPASTTSVGTPPLPPIDASFNLSLLGPLALVSLLLIVALLVLRYVRLAKSPSQAGLLSVVAQASPPPKPAPAPTIPVWPTTWSATSRPRCTRSTGTPSPPTACAAKSSPPASPTA